MLGLDRSWGLSYANPEEQMVLDVMKVERRKMDSVTESHGSEAGDRNCFYGVDYEDR